MEVDLAESNSDDEEVKIFLDENDRLVDQNGEPHQILDEFDCARSIYVDAEGKVKQNHSERFP